MKDYLANVLLKKSNLSRFIFVTLLPPSLYFRHLILFVSLMFTSGLHSQSYPQNKLLIFSPHHPHRNIFQMLRLCQVLLMGLCLLFGCSHNCNHIFMYFVIVMKLCLSVFCTACFYQARASVFSISIYCMPLLN